MLASQRLRPARSILASRDSLVHTVQVSCNFTMYMSWQDDATSEHSPELRPAVPNSATGVSAEPLFCFRQLLAWLGRASRARSARPFTATLPSTPHYHTRRLTSHGPQAPQALVGSASLHQLHLGAARNQYTFVSVTTVTESAKHIEGDLSGAFCEHKCLCEARWATLSGE